MAADSPMMICDRENTNVPSPSRRARDGEGSTKPLAAGGSCFCRGRPHLGRAAVRIFDSQPKSLEIDCTLVLRVDEIIIE